MVMEGTGGAGAAVVGNSVSVGPAELAVVNMLPPAAVVVAAPVVGPGGNRGGAPDAGVRFGPAGTLKREIGRVVAWLVVGVLAEVLAADVAFCFAAFANMPPNELPGAGPLPNKEADSGAPDEAGVVTEPNRGAVVDAVPKRGFEVLLELL